MIKNIIFSAAILLLSLNAISQDYYVSLKGNDKNNGTIEKPFASLDKVKEVLLKTTTTNKMVHVYLRKGIYYIDKTFVLTKKEVKFPLTIEAYKEEAVTIRTSKVVPVSLVQKIQDMSTLQRIHTSLKDSIVEIDLKALNIINAKTYPDVFDGSGDLFELFMNEQRMPLSRYPNEGFMTMKKVMINGGGQEVKGDWSQYYTEGNKPPTGKPRPGVFEYRDSRTAKWMNALNRGVWLKGFWRIPWQNEAIRIANIDTIKHTIAFAAAIGGGIGNKYNRPFGDGKERYWLLNLLEEIDRPGEWAIDFKDKKLYFYPPVAIKEGNIRISDNSAPSIFLDEVKNVSIKKIKIDENLGTAVIIKNGDGNTVAGCSIKNIGGYAVKIDMGFNHTVKSCDLSELGIGGVWLSGGNANVSPRIPANHKVVNNHIYRFSLIQRVYAGAVDVGYIGGGSNDKKGIQCVGMYVAHNLIHNTPHVGILFGGWDNVFEYNEIFDYCQVSDDMGGFYSFETYPYMGNQIFAYNFLHNSDIGDGIYFDYDHRDMHIYGNIVALNSAPKRRGTGILYKIGTQTKNPYSEKCYNNITINCNYGYQFFTALPTKSKIENNVAVTCQKDFSYKYVTDKAHDSTSTMASGKNVSYLEDPGFVNMSGYDFRLKPDSKIFKDLPDFKPIPIDKIGLFRDEFRKKLPTDNEIKRFETTKQLQNENGSEILDRN